MSIPLVVIKNAELLASRSKSFNLTTLNSLILLIDRDSEIRDELKAEVISTAIMNIYKSDTVTKKIDETDRSNLSLFMNNGFKYYVNMVLSNRRRSWYKRLFACSSKPKQVYSCVPSNTIQVEAIAVLPSPMEVVQEREIVADLIQPPSQDPLDNSEPIGASINEPSSSSDAIPEKL